MKKILALFISTLFLMTPAVMALEQAQTVEAPKWEEYVPEKYQEPRTDFTRGSAIAELSVGIVLTDLLITAPIGIPMICHSTTKLKNISYAEKKVKFEKGLKEAETITDPKAKQEYYDNLLEKCKFSEGKRQKQLKKSSKEEAKAVKKAQKQAKKAAKK